MMKIDFEDDLRQEIQRVSKDIGFKISINQDFHKILLDYLTVWTKFIDPKIRKILINPDFKQEMKNHPKKKEIDFIVNYAKQGKNLNFFQSKKLLQSNFHDHLQNEWNIYHFHLSLKKDKKSGFVKQVNSILFAFITDDTIAFLGSDTHKDGIFGDVKWIEILHNHFPGLIEKYRENTILDIHPNLNSVERQTIWDKGLSMGMTKIKGVIYHNPGIGRMLSGHSMKVSKSVMEMTRWINKLKEQIDSMEKELLEYLKTKQEKAEFRIRFGDKTLELVEISSKTMLVEFPNILIDKEELLNRINTGYNK